MRAGLVVKRGIYVQSVGWMEAHSLLLFVLTRVGSDPGLGEQCMVGGRCL